MKRNERKHIQIENSIGIRIISKQQQITTD